MEQFTIERGLSPGLRSDFVGALKWLPGMGERKAGEVFDGAKVTLVIPADKSAVSEARIKSLVEFGKIIVTKEGDMNQISPVVPAAPAAPIQTPPVVPGDFGAAFAGMVLPYVSAQIQGLVDAAIGARVPREIVIKAADKPDHKINGHVHPEFEKILRLCKAGVSVMLVGPAGCGKTHLFSQVSEALGLEHSSISLSGGVTEAHLTGRLLPTGDGGRFVYTESPFVRRYANGGAFLLDEMDGADPNVLLAINQATANGGFDIEARAASGLDTYVKRHPEAMIMATANTYGTGSGALYVGRNQLDAATLDRWYTVQMDYDKAYEEKIAPSQVTHFVWRLRDTINDNRWRRVASTRMIQKAAAALSAGLTWPVVKADLLSGFTADERSKINF